MYLLNWILSWLFSRSYLPVVAVHLCICGCCVVYRCAEHICFACARAFFSCRPRSESNSLKVRFCLSSCEPVAFIQDTFKHCYGLLASPCITTFLRSLSVGNEIISSIAYCAFWLINLFARTYRSIVSREKFNMPLSCQLYISNKFQNP